MRRPQPNTTRLTLLSGTERLGNVARNAFVVLAVAVPSAVGACNHRAGGGGHKEGRDNGEDLDLHFEIWEVGYVMDIV